MSEISDLKLAKETYEVLCNAMEKMEWQYEKDEEEMIIQCGANGESMPISLLVMIDAESMLVLLFSKLSIAVPEDKRLDMAVVINVVNNSLVSGFFEYDVIEGSIYFRKSNSFVGSKLGEELFEYMLNASCRIIDMYSEKFLMLAKDILSIEKFLESIESN